MRLEQAQKEAAERIHSESRRFVARRMLWDSPSERLKLKHRALTSFGEFPRWMKAEVKQFSMEPEPDFEFGVFEDNKTRINVNSVSVFVSKSGSVFYPALDELDEAAKNLHWPATAWDFWGVYRALNESHAFDDGNRKAITWIDNQRTDLLSRTDPYFRFRLETKPKPLHPIDSKDSFFIQAADIAAGVVTGVWYRETLVAVARTFEYVTYNGRRIGESDAQLITAKLNRRNHP